MYDDYGTHVAPGTYAHHLATCLVCSMGKACQHAREKYGA